MRESRLVLVLCGLACIVAGLFPMVTALGIVPAWEEKMNAPRWVVFLAGSLFFMAGTWLLLQAAVGEAAVKAFGSVVGVAALVGLTAISNWVAFGGGDRSDCSGGISVLGFGFSQVASEIECRAAFGYGALLIDGILLRGIAWWIAKGRPESRVARACEKVAEWGIGLLLLPLILLALLLSAVNYGSAKLANKLRPGKRPPPEVRK